MYEGTVEQTFAAGHALREYKGKCENVHGHNYRVQITVEGERLNRIGLLVDFVELKRAVREVVAILDHQFINDLEPFTVINPSAENIAKYFYDQVSARMGAPDTEAPARIAQIKIWETDTSIAVYPPLSESPSVSRRAVYNPLASIYRPKKAAFRCVKLSHF